MLNDGFVSTLDDTGDKLFCAVGGDLVFALVASATGLFYQGQQGGIGRSVQQLRFRSDNFHFFIPFLLNLDLSQQETMYQHCSK